MTSIITNLIKNELLNPTWEMTKQYLKILDVKYDNKIPEIIKIDFDSIDNRATAYIELTNEPFYLEFHFDTKNKIEILSIDTAPYIAISYMSTSDTLTLEELLSITTINPTKVTSKEESKYSYNGLEFNSYEEPGTIDSKLDFLLHILESDINGIKELSKQTDCKDLFITLIYHNGTGIFSGLHLSSQQINRLSKLGFELVFDIHSSGEKFITE